MAINLIFEYDRNLVSTNSTSGKYVVCIYQRARPRFNTFCDDFKGGIREVFNQLCFEHHLTTLFLTISEHRATGWINIESKSFRNEYMLGFSTSGADKPTLKDVASYLQSETSPNS
ncbi:MAG: hypothetical protein K0S09_1900 [Sphingobacteriaceae bacterium]|jgi:hypothetical protein|nr:hypothetical protein [Sphingobacteriaceae bacterium]